MRQAPAVVGCLWAAFVLLWVILAQFSKKGRRGTHRKSALAVRLSAIIGLIFILSFRHHAAAGFLGSISRAAPLHPGIPWQWLGVGLCLVGFGFAIWARTHLGRNWGMPMSLRQGHELVTSGPYAHVRHPIYTGIMLAMIGSALAVGLTWLLLFVLYFAYFLFSARTEEKMMAAQFPDTYPAYRRGTKMLIPFVF